MSYRPPVGEATASTRGLIKLTGDFSGTADSPTVPGLAGKANTAHTHTAAQISDSTAVGQAVLTATDVAAAQSALAIANTVQVVNAFTDVTTPVYGTLYVVRA